MTAPVFATVNPVSTTSVRIVGPRTTSRMIKPDPFWTWEAALARALRMYVYAKLKCFVYRDDQGRWRSVVIKEN